MALPSCESPSGMTTVSQPKMSPAADIPAEETELTWKDISQLLKHKLTSASFAKALRYSQEHGHESEHAPSTFDPACVIHWWTDVGRGGFHMNCFPAASSTRLEAQLEVRKTSVWETSFLTSSRSRAWSPGLTSTMSSYKHPTGLMRRTLTSGCWRWEERFLKLAFFLGSQRPNRVRFGSAVFYPEGYLAYSAPGSVEVRSAFNPL